MTVDQVATARKKRTGLPVLLAKYMNVRELKPTSILMIFEGDDDLGVWPVWFSRCGVSTDFEPLPCNGKEMVLKLRKRLGEKLSFDPGRRLFFVDRDYDDLAGHPEGADVLITDRYSIENYFLCHRVIDFILNTMFGCAGHLAEKDRVLRTYKDLLDSFIDASREVNFRAFCIRRMRRSDEPRKKLPVNLRDFVEIKDIVSISPHRKSAEDIIPFDEEISTEEIERLRREFDELDPHLRYRGKFFKSFLVYFLGVLQMDRNAENRVIFPNTLPQTKIRYSGLFLSNFAGVSDLPIGLKEFLEQHSLLQAA